MRPQLGPLQASPKLHLRDRHYRSKRLAAKSHRMEGEKIIGCCYLRGRMPLESHACIRFGHTFPVIGHLDQCTTGILDIHLNMSGSGINRIFHQFLNDRGRTLDHLACRYLIGDTVRK